MPIEVTRELWEITEREMLPAATNANCCPFGDALYRFGRLAGECFAPVQGGPFASPKITQLVEALRARWCSRRRPILLGTDCVCIDSRLRDSHGPRPMAKSPSGLWFLQRQHRQPEQPSATIETVPA